MSKYNISIDLFPKQLFGLIFCTATAMIGYHIHHSGWYAFWDFIFAPIVWIKWLIFHEVTWNIIKDTFTWFFQ